MLSYCLGVTVEVISNPCPSELKVKCHTLLSNGKPFFSYELKNIIRTDNTQNRQRYSKKTTTTTKKKRFLKIALRSAK